MTKQVEGVYERVLACAKEEFLEKGFSKSSLRTIAAKADTTTGTIYSRFGGKEGLFSAIVEPVSDRIIKMFLETQESFHALDAKEQPSMMETYVSEGMKQYLTMFMITLRNLSCYLMHHMEQNFKTLWKVWLKLKQSTHINIWRQSTFREKKVK